MSIQITCHKYLPDILTKKLLTIRVFIHFDDEVAESEEKEHQICHFDQSEKSIYPFIYRCIDLSLSFGMTTFLVL
jgi:hypothetical protein